MKTAKQVLDKIIIGMPDDDRMKDFIIMAMEDYAKSYHENELKKLRVGDVSQRSELFNAILDFTEELPAVTEDYDRAELWEKYKALNCG